MNTRTIRLLLLSFLLCFTAAAAIAQSPADKIIGTYYVKDDQSPEEAKIRIYKTTNGTYAGRMVWVKNPTFKDGTPKRDIMNPDPKKRDTPADQIQMLSHFTYDAAKNAWVDGFIYDPVHGKTYKCKMWFGDDKTLKIRGYIGVPAFGRTMSWTKVQDK